MEIVKNIISVKLSQDEKTYFQKTMEIIDKISRHPDIIDGCDGLCPFSHLCDQSNCEHGQECLLEKTYANLRFILHNSL